MLIIVTLSATANYKPHRIFYNSLTAFQDTGRRIQADTTKPLRTDTTRPGRFTDPRRGADGRRLTDTTRPGRAGDAGSDTIPVTRTDTLDLRISKDSLDAPVNYSASDSVVLDVPTKKITLYNQANTKYKDLDLTGSIITLDQPRRLVIATYTRDSLGNIVGLPKFVQGESSFIADSIIYNIETQRGLTRNSYMQQGEIHTYG